MATYFSGSDGNIYVEPYDNQFTASLYKTQYIQIVAGGILGYLVFRDIPGFNVYP